VYPIVARVFCMRLVQKLQLPSNQRFANNRLSTTKKVDFIKKSAFWGSLVPDVSQREPTGFSNQSADPVYALEVPPCLAGSFQCAAVEGGMG
jgi:hypothetical protein